jgi:hypothetical protein
VTFSSRTTENVFRKRGAIPLALALALIGCGKEEIKVYQVSKDKTEPPPMVNPHGSKMVGNIPRTPAESLPHLTWTQPSGWETVAPGEVRVASFNVKGPGNKQADVSIVPLPGLAGGDLNNVNRWRGTVGLQPVAQEELSKVAERVEIAGLESSLYEQAGQNPAEDGKTRILAAIQHREGTAWFFKMTGDDELVAQQKPAFIEFLKSLRFEAAEAQPALPPSHPPIESLAGQPPAAGASETKPSWEVPGGWKAEPPSEMLLAKFSATDNAARAEITVSSFPGDVGGLLANVNRWRQQVKLAPIDETGLAQAVSQLEVPVGKGSLVDLNGTDAKTGQKARLVGVAVPHGGQTWFFKMLGDEPVVAREKDAFLKFVQSVKYPNAP